MDRKFVLQVPECPSTERHPENYVIRVDDLPPYEVPLQQIDWLEGERVNKALEVAKTDTFVAGEHKLTAEALKLRDIHGQILKANDVELATIKGTIKLKFGDIIALAGDFFTNREPGIGYFPICEAPGFGDSEEKDDLQRFRNAVISLTQDSDGFLANLMGLLQKEHKTVVDTRSRDESVAQA
jgi:hypothetical protein